ncbi:MAG: autotransporter outer membrane beta-barrel domain-containing protein [Candidatus Anaerobiospirillum merdipullorum]|uniref:Autotransporter outer membrane beta-barrel domain-containing protein n=1 Tax=Candidatus Anaerobiospirillum merdipullorum TaxID=2838450 RepID=A0A9E2NRI7_9GAMM|nr:autotransporter outer membrane beta-barrel domain-containing protein [Candidatus Anaerobiospirillum merdipullorum]
MKQTKKVLLTRSLMGLAVATAFTGTASYAADPSFNYINQTNIEEANAIPAYRQISSDASSVTFKEVVGSSGQLPGINNGTVSAINDSYLVFEKGLFAGSSGYQKSAISVQGGSKVEVYGSAGFSTSGAQGNTISLSDDSTLRLINANKVSIRSSGYQSSAVVADSSTIEVVNTQVSYSSNSVVGIKLTDSSLKVTDGSTVTSSSKRSTEINNSDVYVAEGSTFGTYNLTGSGSVEATGNSTITVSNNMNVAGTVNLTDSSLFAKTSTISDEGLNVAGKSSYTADSLALTNADMHLSGETGQSVNVGSLTGENVEYYLGNTEGKITIDEADVTNLTLHASGEVTDATSGDANKALSHFGIANSSDSENVILLMDEGMYSGETTAVVGADGVSNVTTKTNTLMQSNLELATAAPLALNRIMLTDLRKRMGDIRSDEGNYGMWARYDGGRLSGSNGLENNFHSIHVGGDAKLGQWRLGAGFSYTNGDVDYARGDADMDAYGLELYGMWLGEGGQFVDLVARVSSADTDMEVDASKTGSMDTMAYSLSAEFGWRFALTEQFYVEPQVEAAYTYIDTDDLDIANASYEFDAVNSFTGRAGFAAGIQLPEKIGDLYVHASVVHEFSGDAEITGGNGSKYSIDGQDTWYEYGLGATFHLTDSTYVWTDLQRTSSAVLDEDWRANVGVRYSF